MSVCAKRGDWLAVVTTETMWYIGQPNETRERVDLMQVTSCKRDGYVKECRDASGYIDTRWTTGRVLIIPPSVVASDDVRRVALAHHWDGHPNQPKPFDSLNEVRDALRPYRLERAS